MTTLWQIIFTAIWVTATAGTALCATGQSGRGDAQMVIYLEVPAPGAESLILELASVILVGEGEGRSKALHLLHTDLRASELAGSQIRLVDQYIPAGTYSALELTLDKITGRVGAAEVSPALPPEPLHIPLALHIPAGHCEMVVLRWSPRPIDIEAPYYEPDLSLGTAEVPPLGSLAFVSNEGSGNVSVIDFFRGKVVDVIMVGPQPRDLVYAQSEQLLYVALAGNDAVAVVDVFSMQTIRILGLRFGDKPSRLLLSEDESTLYVLNYGSMSLALITLLSDQEVARISVGQHPRAITLDRQTGYVYVTSELAGEILIYDPFSDRTVTTLTIDSAPAEVLFNSSGKVLYLGSSTRRRLLVLDTQSGGITAQLNLCATITGLAYSPSSRRLFVAMGTCREVTVTQPESELEINSIKLPASPGLMTFDKQYRQLFVTLPEAAAVAVCNPNNIKLDQLIGVGESPYRAIAP